MIESLIWRDPIKDAPPRAERCLVQMQSPAGPHVTIEEATYQRPSFWLTNSGRRAVNVQQWAEWPKGTAQ